MKSLLNSTRMLKRCCILRDADLLPCSVFFISPSFHHFWSVQLKKQPLCMKMTALKGLWFSFILAMKRCRNSSTLSVRNKAAYLHFFLLRKKRKRKSPIFLCLSSSYLSLVLRSPFHKEGSFPLTSRRRQLWLQHQQITTLLKSPDA